MSDFKDYPHSSFHSFLTNKKTKLDKGQVLNWFGGEKEFLNFHESKPIEKDFSSFLID